MGEPTADPGPAQFTLQPIAEEQQRLVTVSLAGHPQQPIQVGELSVQRLRPGGGGQVVPGR